MLIHLRDRIYYTSPAKQSYGACFMSLLLTLNLFFVGAQLATLLSTSRAPSVQWFLLAFPFLISLSISNGVLVAELNVQYRGLHAASVSPEVCHGEHDWPSTVCSCCREELGSRTGNDQSVFIYYLYFMFASIISYTFSFVSLHK